MDKVEEFIQRRFPATADANWLNGNCYWFAKILCTRFPFLEMYYLPIEGHFVAGDSDTHQYYDWSGLVSLQETPLLISSIAFADPTWCKRILRDCRD